MASCGAATSAGAAAWGPAVSLRVGLSSGHEMPMLGLGTYQLLPEDLARVVPHALGACGYRLLDTAAVYKNEAAVGEAIRASGVPREEVFVTTKLHPKDHGEERAYEAALAALGRLGLDYIDLLLVHWPGVAKRSPADKGNAAARRSTWSGLQRLVEDGKARSIGVSNYTAAHLDDLCEWEGCTIRPAVNQIEVSPLCQQREIQAACRRWGVHIQAYASLAQGSDALLLNPAVESIAAKHALSPSQLCLLWALQQGFSVIPRSRSTLRVTSNALPHRLVRGGSGLALSAKADGAREATAPDAVALADDELDAISALDPGDDSGRQCWNPNTAEGFDGVEAALCGIPEGAELKFADRVRAAGLRLIAQVHTAGYTGRPSADPLAMGTNNQAYVGSQDIEEHLLHLESSLWRCRDMKAEHVNVHGGHDSWPLEKAVEYLSRAVGIAEKAGISISHETHRRRLMWNPWQTRSLAAAVPGLRITADLSHWVCACERVFGSDSDAEWPVILEAVAGRTALVHARVGYSEGPQVPHPAAPEVAFEVKEHLSWWRTIVRARVAAGAEELFVEPEFGPPGYQRCTPFRLAAEGDIWEMNTYMAARVVRMCQGVPGVVAEMPAAMEAVLRRCDARAAAFMRGDEADGSVSAAAGGVCAATLRMVLGRDAEVSEAFAIGAVAAAACCAAAWLVCGSARGT